MKVAEDGMGVAAMFSRRMATFEDVQRFMYLCFV